MATKFIKEVPCWVIKRTEAVVPPPTTTSPASHWQEARMSNKEATLLMLS